MNREDVTLIFLCFFHFWRFQAPWWPNSEINNARKKPVGYVKRHIMTYLHIKNYGPKIHGLGRTGKNVSILGTFCWLAWEQKWPPYGHFESGHLLFLWVSRHSSLTYLCYILATHILWLLKFSPNYVKNRNFEIQNGRRFWGQGPLGSKRSMPLDSQWVVSYWCVIHYEAIFLTVCELLAKMSDFLVKFEVRAETKMATVRSVWIRWPRFL